MNSRKPPLISTPATFREALYLMVEHCGVKVEGQAAHLHVHPSYLYNAANPHRDEDGPHYQARLFVPHIQLTQSFVALDWIEQAVGRVAVFLPSATPGAVEPATADNLPTYVCRLMQEIGDVARVSGERLGDRDLSAADRLRIRKEVRDVIQKAVQIDVALQGGEGV